MRWAQALSPSQPDFYRVVFTRQEEPDRELLIRKCGTEHELEEFLNWELGCEESVVKRAIADLRHGREVKIERNGLNDLATEAPPRSEASGLSNALPTEGPDADHATPDTQQSYAAAACGPMKETGVETAGNTMIPAPQTLEETGVSTSLLEDLTIKALFMQGEQSLSNLTEHLGLSFAVVEEIFGRLRKEQFVEIKGMSGLAYRTALTDRGRSRAIELLSLNKYAGHAPVCLNDYTSRVRAQSVTKADVHPSGLQRALGHLVLDAATLKRLGTATVSGTSILLYGPSGTGKTSIAEVLPNVYGDSVWIPYAIEVAGQIVTVYDRGIHRAIDKIMPEESDGRWVLCRRPQVMVGGELTIGMLDLLFDPVGKMYSAPIQMKANNGVLIVDDFGRQLVRPEDLLNRWIVPLDRGIDFLNLGGEKFEIPFDQFLVFASNLEPARLGDEAFLRRLTNKIKIDYLRAEQFHEIFRRLCPKFGLFYDAEVVDYAIEVLAKIYKEPLRACQPRDIVRQICWSARYEGYTPKLDRASITEACRNHLEDSASTVADLAAIFLDSRGGGEEAPHRKTNGKAGLRTVTS